MDIYTVQNTECILGPKGQMRVEAALTQHHAMKAYWGVEV
jgi:hypothetical protein